MTEENDPARIDKPPLFRSWRGWYTLVLVSLMIMILLLYAFTIAFA
jgi:hypothetical protein